MARLRFTVVGPGGGERILRFVPRELVLAGWTGRSARDVQAHISELAALGVPPPSATPLFYRASAVLLSTAERLEVLGTRTSGEVEPVMIWVEGESYIGLGSDHTDRDLETVSVAASKQQCSKALGARLWRWHDVADHWDRVVLRSHLVHDGGLRELYQEGGADSLLSPADLLRLYGGGEPVVSGTVVFCGTIPTRSLPRCAPRFEIELEDPVRQRTLRHGYDITTLPIVR